jgi:hypothetical protein
MDYQKALVLKQEMSASMLAKKRGNTSLVSFAAGTKGAIINRTTDFSTHINGVGITTSRSGESVIKIFTRGNLRSSPAALAQSYGMTVKDILVEQIGQVEFKSHKARHRPPFPGLSIGHYKVTAGTLGCFVQDSQQDIYILSNNHVLANTNDAFGGDAILQPGRLDNGRTKNDAIARLTHLVPLQFTNSNSMDAAIAKVNDHVDIIKPIANKITVTGISMPTTRLKVEKYGRTSGYTTGTITTRNLDLEIDFDGRLIAFEDQFEIKGSIKNGKRTKFCEAGDSGSLILESGTGNAVGLLFAGSRDGTSFATPISEILTAFSVKIL